MLLDPALRFCRAIKVPKEARIVTRLRKLDAPTIAALNRLLGSSAAH